MKTIRNQLQTELGCDMEPYKKVLKKHVDYFCAHLDERETVEPLPVSDDEEEGEGGAKGKVSKAAAAGKDGRQQQQEDAKEQPHVVVVGAGLTGLVAATVLQVSCSVSLRGLLWKGLSWVN